MHVNSHFAIALLIRVAFLAFGCIQDSLSELKYTDVDYRVFTDAALHVAEGRSPFLRPTYRYTPLVALLLVPNVLLHDAFGKLLFSVFDVIVSVLVHGIQRRAGFDEEACRTSVFLWLYNPLAVVISTRGSAESLVTFLVVLCVRLAERPLPLGLVFGLAVHFKIFPCIHAASFYFALSSSLEASLGLLLRPSRAKVTFIAMSAVGFFAPTLASLLLYGEEYLREALLYHLTRKDIRHNFSPFFYPSYLLESQGDDRLSALVSTSAFAVQAALLAFVSGVFAGRTRTQLPACMFVQTFMFVSLNKVCTSQYFAWYLCLLPMSWPLIAKKRVDAPAPLHLLAAWTGAQALWLLSAFLLEFEGWNTFFLLFVSTLVFFSINIYLVCVFIKCLKTSYSDEIKMD